MKRKWSTRIAGVKPEIILGLLLMQEVFKMYDEEITLTSLTDGEHSTRSYHPMGYAIDLRLPVFADAKGLCTQLDIALGPEFDVFLEIDHIHVEFDVRKAR
jgi:hypothetical protein